MVCFLKEHHGNMPQQGFLQGYGSLSRSDLCFKDGNLGENLYFCVVCMKAELHPDIEFLSLLFGLLL